MKKIISTEVTQNTKDNITCSLLLEDPNPKFLVVKTLPRITVEIRKVKLDHFWGRCVWEQ